MNWKQKYLEQEKLNEQVKKDLKNILNKIKINTCETEILKRAIELLSGIDLPKGVL